MINCQVKMNEVWGATVKIINWGVKIMGSGRMSK